MLDVGSFLLEEEKVKRVLGEGGVGKEEKKKKKRRKQKR